VAATPAGAPAPRAQTELVGQDAARDVLARALDSGRLAHGWLLHGPAGIGKATLAYRFARALLAGPGACGPGLALAPDHPVFRQIAQGAYPDLTVIEPERDPKSGRLRVEIPVGAVRAAGSALHATAAMGGWRVVLVDGAERLNRNAANALLKSLEEPPAGAVILLVSSRPAQVAATLRSRCAKLALARLPDALVLDGLARYAAAVDGEQRRAIALLARGSLGRGLELADQDWLPLYQRLAQSLGDEPGDGLALHELAGALAGHAEQRGLAGSLTLLQELLGRIVAAGCGRLGAPLFATEAAALERLAAGRPLDRWAALWDKVRRLAAAVDRLNLDRTQTILHILTLLAPAGGRDEAAALAMPSGAYDVLG
jgi:DNA polymerase III subunit delta'